MSFIFSVVQNLIHVFDLSLQSEGISLGHLQDEVRRIIVHLQDNRNVLTKGDVEAIVQHMLQQEIKQLRLGLDEVQNDHKATIVSLMIISLV
jgi:hypothetical protein